MMEIRKRKYDGGVTWYEVYKNASAADGFYLACFRLKQAAEKFVNSSPLEKT